MKNAVLMAAALTLFSCGGAGSGQVDLQIDTSAVAVLGANLQTIIVVLFAGDQSCEVIKFSGPSIRGVYQSSISLADSADNPNTTFNTLAPDTYTVAAWGFEFDDEAISFGCASSPVQIYKDELAEVSLEMAPYSP